MLTEGQNFIQLVQQIMGIISSSWSDWLGNLGCGCLALTATKNCCKIKLSLQLNGNSPGMPNYKKCTGATREPWLKASAVDAFATDPDLIEPLCWIKQIGGGSSHSSQWFIVGSLIDQGHFGGSKGLFIMIFKMFHLSCPSLKQPVNHRMPYSYTVICMLSLQKYTEQNMPYKLQTGWTN